MLDALSFAAPLPAGPDQLVRLLIVLAVMLAAGKFSGELFDRIGQPAVLGVAGRRGAGWKRAGEFEIGLETDLKQLLRVGPGASSLAVVGVITVIATTFLAPPLLKWSVRRRGVGHRTRHPNRAAVAPPGVNQPR